MFDVQNARMHAPVETYSIALPSLFQRNRLTSRGMTILVGVTLVVDVENDASSEEGGASSTGPRSEVSVTRWGIADEAALPRRHLHLEAAIALVYISISQRDIERPKTSSPLDGSTCHRR